MLGVAIFTAPIQRMFGNAVLTYNVAYIGSYVLAGFGMFLLTRALWGRADAAVLSGLAFALTPYRLAQSDHLQVLMNGWMPIGLLGLHRYFASGSRGWLLVFAAAYLLTGLSNGTTCISSCSRSVWWSAWSCSGRGCRGGASSATSQSPQWGSRRRWRRLSSCTSGFSSRCASRAIQTCWRAIAPGLRITSELPPGPGTGEACCRRQRRAAAVSRLRRHHLRGRGRLHRCRRRSQRGIGWHQRRTVIAYGLIAALAVWLSMGPGPWRPYGWLFRFVPGFNGMRVPARLASIVILALAVLAGAGFARLFDRLSRRWAAVAAMAFAAVIVLEGQHRVRVREVPGWREQQLGSRGVCLVAEQSSGCRARTGRSPGWTTFKRPRRCFSCTRSSIGIRSSTATQDGRRSFRSCWAREGRRFTSRDTSPKSCAVFGELAFAMCSSMRRRSSNRRWRGGLLASCRPRTTRLPKPTSGPVHGRGD